MSFVKIVFDTLKVFILFTGCTLLFYYGIVWLHQEYEHYHRYDEPEGGALKVSAHYVEESPSWLDRLIYFYQTGE
ncbi:YqzK family protein [Calidifontibacillus erzurumensis]|uniref:YqzK family protein n=1 Tax=Calidifontibacillus erzurumensis TaxID=2741433 RepID=A0A8J8GEN9_9BACI|nr:YqzK family protein [Calidifontibacillus erzurumensis]NSL50443.1 YqzK family protein [Calidifontibacillus erzurumensis]